MGEIIHFDFRSKSRRDQVHALAVEYFGKYLKPESAADLADRVCESVWRIEDAIAEDLRLNLEDVTKRFERVARMASDAIGAAARDALIHSAGEDRGA